MLKITRATLLVKQSEEIRIRAQQVKAKWIRGVSDDSAKNKGISNESKK